MQEISAKLVKELRDKTGAGIMECKQALKECNANMEEAVSYLRKRGLSKAAKKADRVAAEGAIAMKISQDFKKGILVEINSETDFVAKNESFKNLVSKIIECIDKNDINDISQLENAQIDNMNFSEYLKNHIAVIGENIVVRRLEVVKCKDNEILNGYVHHNFKIGTICTLNFKDSKNIDSLSKFAKDLAVHIACMKPKVIDFTSFSKEFIATEKEAIIAELEKENEDLKRLGKNLNHIPSYISLAEISDEIIQKKKEELKEQLKAQKKPEAIWDKILPGQIDRFIKDNSLLDQRIALLYQPFSDELGNVKNAIDAKNKQLSECINIAKFVNFELGDGIEKKVDDFAKEVAAQMK